MGCPRLNGVLAALGKPLCCPPGKVHLPARLGDGGVLVSLELCVIVGELVVENGDGHAVKDDAKGDAGEGKDSAQVGLRQHVAVANCGNTHLKDEGDTEEERVNQKILNINLTKNKKLDVEDMIVSVFQI